MTEKRYTWNSEDVVINDNITGKQLEVIDITEIDVLLDLLNEQEEEIQRLKIQLQTDDVCNKCKHEYLVQQNDGYYISKCKKGFDECSKGTIKYCEDFELKCDVE